MIKIAVFASGSGSNAQRIVEYFAARTDIIIACILSNRSDAYVLERAKKLNIPSYCFTGTELYNTNKVTDILDSCDINFIVLAGFLLKIPANIIEKFPDRIVNIHPALLPKYGGKGMYGDNVHKAVVDNREKETGITIHKVNEKYDEGQPLFQASCTVEPSDTPVQVAEKVHTLEYEWFPVIIEKYISDSILQ